MFIQGKIFGTVSKDFRAISSNWSINITYYYLDAWNVSCMAIVLGGSCN